jgi:hypothetical protein
MPEGDGSQLRGESLLEWPVATPLRAGIDAA